MQDYFVHEKRCQKRAIRYERLAFGVTSGARSWLLWRESARKFLGSTPNFSFHCA